MFETVVELYRLLGRPELDDDRIVFDGICSPDVKQCVERCRQLHVRYGELIDADEHEGKISIEFNLPTSDAGRFHESFTDFIRSTPTLGKGKLPENFYIVDENWSTTDQAANINYLAIKTCCELINGLCGLVAVADRVSCSTHENIFFALPADERRKPKTFVLETRVDESVLSVELRHVKIVALLAASYHEHKLHVEERKLIFSAAIADVIDSAPDGVLVFPFILKHWDDVLQKYWQNLQAYVHGFSFDKVRSELAKAELEYGSKLSSVLSDMAGKFLALPVTFGALVLLNKAVDPIEIFAIAIGIFVVTIIFCGVLWNQHLNIRRLDSSLDITFELFDKRLDTYPQSLQRLLNSAKKEILSQRSFLRWTLWFFFVVAIIPTFIMVGMLSWDWLLMIGSAVFNFLILVGTLTDGKLI